MVRNSLYCNMLFRGIVSNLLLHREYASTFSSKLLIFSDRVITENWTKPVQTGNVTLDTLETHNKYEIEIQNNEKFVFSITYRDVDEDFNEKEKERSSQVGLKQDLSRTQAGTKQVNKKRKRNKNMQINKSEMNKKSMFIDIIVL